MPKIGADVTDSPQFVSRRHLTTELKLAVRVHPVAEVGIG